jgi:hypothetical protein
MENKLFCRPIILPIKDTFTREEVKKILLEHFVHTWYPNPCPEGSDHDKNRQRINEWFDKNY